MPENAVRRGWHLFQLLRPKSRLNPHFRAAKVGRLRARRPLQEPSRLGLGQLDQLQVTAAGHARHHHGEKPPGRRLPFEQSLPVRRPARSCRPADESMQCEDTELHASETSGFLVPLAMARFFFFLQKARFCLAVLLKQQCPVVSVDHAGSVPDTNVSF